MERISVPEEGSSTDEAKLDVTLDEQVLHNQANLFRVLIHPDSEQGRAPRGAKPSVQSLIRS